MGKPSFFDGLSYDKPPFFDGSSYDYWKRKMSAHVKSMNRKIWEVVGNDFAVIDPTHPTAREEEKVQFNDIAINILYEALDVKVFEQIKDLERAHDVWTRLEESYEGTNTVKGAKLCMLKDKYTSFKMQEGDTILEMFDRLQTIVVDLKSLGEKVEDEDFSHRFLRCLPPRFDTLVTILVRDGLKTMTPNQELGDMVTQDTYHVERDGLLKKKRRRRRKVWHSKWTLHHLRARAKQRKKSQVLMSMLVVMMMKMKRWPSLYVALENS
jgi:hypothetical protein